MKLREVEIYKEKWTVIKVKSSYNLIYMIWLDLTKLVKYISAKSDIIFS